VNKVSYSEGSEMHIKVDQEFWSWLVEDGFCLLHFGEAVLVVEI